MPLVFSCYPHWVLVLPPSGNLLISFYTFAPIIFGVFYLLNYFTCGHICQLQRRKILIIKNLKLNTATYQIKLDQFEGPFDLLLFFIERDELDIYNIPITKITNDFLDFIHDSEKLNIELSSEFILFISTLMRIKAKMLIPRKEIDAQGNEIDPRQELINKILEYKRFKEASLKMAELEEIRMLMIKRGNLQKELSQICEEFGEGTEIQAVTLFKLMKARIKCAHPKI